MSLKQIEKLECGSWFGRSWYGEKIPELTKVFKNLPQHKEIFVEVKTNKEIVPYLMNNIYKSELNLEQITVISFYPEVIKEIKSNDLNLKCNLLIAFDYEEMSINEIIEKVQATGANGVGAQNHSRLNEELIQALKNIKKTVHVWTVNSKREAENYVHKGIDTITTNKPLYLRNHLEQLKLS